MPEYFRIRPKMIEQESLSSYLFRLAKHNETTFSAILQRIKQNNYSIQMSQSSYMDMHPYRKINIRLLSELTCMDKEELLRHTLYPIQIGIYSESELKTPENVSVVGIRSFYNSKERWFCPLCLKEANIFKLVWQFNDINFCEIHNLRLQKTCIQCGEVQPYIGNHLIDGSCHVCRKSLISNLVRDELELLTDDEVTLHQFWISILSIKSPFCETQFGLSLKQTISLKILFMIKVGQGEERFSIIWSARQDRANLKQVILKDEYPQTSFLAIVIRFFISSRTPLEQFRNIKVSKEFYDTFFEKDINQKKTEIQARNCETPWCIYKNSSRMMHPMNKMNKYNMQGSYYCAECFMVYGYINNTRKWGEIRGKIALIERILIYMKLNYSKSKIYKELSGSTRFTVNDAMGYMYVHNLIPTSYTSVFNAISIPDTKELVLKFNVLINKVGLATKGLKSKARQLFGWDVNEFVCYLHQKEVQTMILNTPKQLKRASSYEATHVLLKEFIKDSEKAKAIHRKIHIGVSSCLLFLYALENLFVVSKILQYEKDVEAQLVECRKLAKQFIQKQANEKKLLRAGDVYRELSRSYVWIKEKSPKLIMWINQKVKDSRRETKLLILKENKEKVDRTIKFMRDHGIAISKSALIRAAGFKNYEIMGQSELSDYCNELLNKE
ncbi:hypothetical protein C5G87_25895 [Paenibacillus peoriae]|uniref:TniQ family protein n=1 Tax=Paenibacillus peoriae TaxID=59893 RepID=UPI000CEBCA8C|nr:TniQ family protein [Paenibacillus peoriae]PPQ46042.1 hypothetical protein C5G87_25895 [Paenibacillus peoriae]